MELTPNKNTSICLGTVDQWSVQSLGQILSVPVTVNEVTVHLDFYVLDIDEGRGGYLIILGPPWLHKVKAVNYWENGQMKIGPKLNHVQLELK